MKFHVSLAPGHGMIKEPVYGFSRKLENGVIEESSTL